MQKCDLCENYYNGRCCEKLRADCIYNDYLHFIRQSDEKSSHDSVHCDGIK